jgi:hypothetical protein
MAMLEAACTDHFTEAPNRVSREIQSAKFDAKSMIQANNFLSIFRLTNLESPDQCHQEEALTGFIAAHVLEDRLKKITESSKLTKFTRRLTGRQSETLAVETALGVINEQNACYIDELNKQVYPKAEVIKTLVDGLFAVIKTRIGKPISYYYDSVRPEVIETWQKGFANTFDSLFSF